MGYAVLHILKTNGAGSSLTAHIERTVDPKNVDKNRTHLNRELVEFPDGVRNRTEAIQHRLENAGLKRKIGKNQNKSFNVMLTGTHEDMAEIEHSGNLGLWCKDNLDWLAENYGRENIVSAVLHLDETTPHIHATVVPIVYTERKRKAREDKVKKNYRTKAPAPRLCLDDILTRKKMEEYQNTYATKMAKYGLERGIRGSEARHIGTTEYYKEVFKQTKEVEHTLSDLQLKQEQAKKQLSQAKNDVSKEKLKNSAADVGSKIIDGVGSLIGTSKVKRLEQQVSSLQEDNADKDQRITNLQGEIAEVHRAYQAEMENRDKEFQKKLSSKDSIIKRAMAWFPEFENTLKLEKQCVEIGFSIKEAAVLITGRAIEFTGRLFSKEHRRYFSVDKALAKIGRDSTDNNSL